MNKNEISVLTETFRHLETVNQNDVKNNFTENIFDNADNLIKRLVSDVRLKEIGFEVTIEDNKMLRSIMFPLMVKLKYYINVERNQYMDILVYFFETENFIQEIKRQCNDFSKAKCLIEYAKNKINFVPKIRFFDEKAELLFGGWHCVNSGRFDSVLLHKPSNLMCMGPSTSILIAHSLGAGDRQDLGSGNPFEACYWSVKEYDLFCLMLKRVVKQLKRYRKKGINYNSPRWTSEKIQELFLGKNLGVYDEISIEDFIKENSKLNESYRHLENISVDKAKEQFLQPEIVFANKLQNEIIPYGYEQFTLKPSGDSENETNKIVKCMGLTTFQSFIIQNEKNCVRFNISYYDMNLLEDGYNKQNYLKRKGIRNVFEDEVVCLITFEFLNTKGEKLNVLGGNQVIYHIRGNNIVNDEVLLASELNRIYYDRGLVYAAWWNQDDLMAIVNIMKQFAKNFLNYTKEITKEDFLFNKIDKMNDLFFGKENHLNYKNEKVAYKQVVNDFKLRKATRYEEMTYGLKKVPSYEGWPEH